MISSYLKKSVGGRCCRIPTSLLPLIFIFSLSGCERYDLDDAESDQRLFIAAFTTSNHELMDEAAKRFEDNFETPKKRSAYPYSECTEWAYWRLEFNLPDIQELAQNWVSDRTEARALETWHEIERFKSKVFEPTFTKCDAGSMPELAQFNRLIELLVTDILNHHDVEALLVEQAEKEANEYAAKKANCELEDGYQKLIFQAFVWQEDLYGLEGRQKIFKELADKYDISVECVDSIVWYATHYRPEWIPERIR